MKQQLKDRVWLQPEILALALGSIVVHLLVISNLEYHRDELLYFSFAGHPATGYATVPPLIGWIAWLMQHIFGYSLFAVRLFPALLGGALIILTAGLTRELGGTRYASFLAGTGLLISIFFLRTYGLFHPVHMEVFLWTLCIFLLTRYVNTGAGRYLVLFGVAAGLALLNKYLVALLFAGLLLIIPFTRHRRVFTDRMFWIGLGAGALIFLPNLLWQVTRNFPVFNHMSELYDTQLVHMDYKLFLTEQLMMAFAGSVLTVAGLVFLLFRGRSSGYGFLGWLSVFVILALMVLKGKSYYTLGVFPLLIAAGAVLWAGLARKLWMKILLPLVLVILSLPVVPVGMPVYSEDGLIRYFGKLEKKYGIDLGRRFEDGSIHSLPQDYADMLGWEEITALAAKAYGMAGDKSTTVIYGENYGQAGAVTVIGKKYGLPEAICFNESFRYWLPLHFDPDIKHLVYINDEAGEDLKTLFGKITLVGRVSNPNAREYGTGVFLCEEPLQSFNVLWTRRLNEVGLLN